MMPEFKEGQYIVYVNGDKYELGRIKSLCPDGAFVAYSEGETGAKTAYDLMHPLVNAYAITDTTLGGSFFNENAGAESKKRSEKRFVYYSMHRPIGIVGTCPKEGMVRFHNYDSRVPIYDVGETWGYIVYNRELSINEMSNYELKYAGSYDEEMEGENYDYI